MDEFGAPYYSGDVVTVLGDAASSSNMHGLKIQDGKSRDRLVMHGDTIKLE